MIEKTASTQASSSIWHTRRELLLPTGLLLLVLFIAAGLRFYRLPIQPRGLSADEIWFALDARQLREGEVTCCPLYFALPFGGHPLFVYLTALAQLLGAPPPISGRIVSAMLSVGSILLAFFTYRSLARSVADKREVTWVGFAGALALATTLAHVIYSRTGLETLLAATLGVPFIWLTGLAFERRSSPLAVAAGGVLGLSLYGYVGADAFVLVVPFFAAWRWLSASPSDRREIVKLAIILLVTAAVVFAPFALTILQAPDQFLGHLLTTSRDTRTGGVGAIVLRLLTNLARIVLTIGFLDDPSEVTHSGRPLYGPVAALFFWVGSVAALVYAWRRHAGIQLALIWVVCASLPAYLSDETPNFGRWNGAYPALAFFVGLGALQVWRAAKKLAWFRTLWGHFALVLAFGAAALFNVHQTTSAHFGGWGTERPAYEMNKTAPRLSAEQALAFTSSTTVYLSPTGDGMVQPVFDLLLRDTSVRQVAGAECLPLAWGDAEPTVYGVVELADKQTLPRLHELYPLGQIVAEFQDTPNPFLYAQFFQVPAGVSPDLPLTPAPVDFAGNVSLVSFHLWQPEPTAGSDIDVDLYWRVNTQPMEELVAFVHVGVAGELQPLAQHDSPPCGGYATPNWLPDEVYPDRHSFRLPDDLPAGEYEIRVGLYHWPSQVRKAVIETELPLVTPDIVVLTTFTVVE